MAVCSGKCHILGRKSTGNIPRHIGRLHIAITEILYPGCPGSMLSGCHTVSHAGKICVADVMHIIKSQLFPYLRTKQPRILVNRVYIVVDNRYIHTTQTVNTA